MPNSQLNASQSNTDFYNKLNSLNDKIRHYKINFGDWDEDYQLPERQKTPDEVPEKSKYKYFQSKPRQNQIVTQRLITIDSIINKSFNYLIYNHFNKHIIM